MQGIMIVLGCALIIIGGIMIIKNKQKEKQEKEIKNNESNN